MNSSLPPGAIATTYHLYEKDTYTDVDSAIIEEVPVCIHVNGQELATMMSTPVDQEALAVGFLASEGFIDGLDDIAVIELSNSGSCVDIWLKSEFIKPERIIRTSGCGGGITFDDLTAERAPLPESAPISIEQIQSLYRGLRSREVLYPVTRGVHASALCNYATIELVAEDVGRHNTLDKLWGKAMMAGLSTEGKIIITTGRVSSEMLGKAAKMGVPLIVSRTSPTSRSIALAQAWAITVIGYLRRGSLRVYSTPNRVTASPAYEAVDHKATTFFASEQSVL